MSSLNNTTPSLQICTDPSLEWLQEEGGMMMDSSSLPYEMGEILTTTRTMRMRPQQEQGLECPRCHSTHTKFCYYNNYSLSQPRYLCKSCRRYWTIGGTLRNIPVGGGSRKNNNNKSNHNSSSSSPSSNKKSSSSSSSSPCANNNNPSDLFQLMSSFPDEKVHFQPPPPPLPHHHHHDQLSLMMSSFHVGNNVPGFMTERINHNFLGNNIINYDSNRNDHMGGSAVVGLTGLNFPKIICSSSPYGLMCVDVGNSSSASLLPNNAAAAGGMVDLKVSADNALALEWHSQASFPNYASETGPWTTGP